MTEYWEAVERVRLGIIEVQIAVADGFSPVLREMGYRLGRWWLDYYCSKPWYWRLWWDIRHSRLAKMVRRPY